MVILRFRHEVRAEDWEDDDDLSDDDDLNESSNLFPAPTNDLGEPSDPYYSKYYSDHLSDMPSDMPSGMPTGMPTSLPFGPGQSGRPTHFGRPSSLSTAVSTSDHSALSDQNGSTSSPAPTRAASDTQPTSSTATAEGFGRGHDGSWEKKEGHSTNGAVYAAAGIVPVVLIAIGVFIFFYLRKRKQRQQTASAQARMQQMKQASQPFVAAHYRNTSIQSQPSEPMPPPSPERPPTRQEYAAPPPGPPPPVILGPIAPTSNGAYFTGIDTSDVVSVNDRTGLGDPFADGNSLNEEPPPPYRPRSLAPLSRDSSLRAPGTAGEQSQTNLLGTRNQDLRSPFADPQDDDAVSVLSGRTLRREHDAMSVVSDLSYQDPVMTRPSL